MRGSPSFWPLLAGCACVATLCAASAGASDANGPARRAIDHLAHTERLLGDPGGARSRLERLGVGLQAFYNETVAWKPRGGAETDDEVGHSGSYDLFAYVDLEELLGVPGTTVLAHAKGQYDRSVNPAVGALSNPIDDADFEETAYLDELWIQHRFLGGRARLRAGLLEQQTTFDRNAFANSEDRQFLSTFLDNSGVVPLPNGLGAVVVVAPWPWLELAAGVADADNTPRHLGFDTAFDGLDGLTSTIEAAVRVRIPTGSGGLPGAYRIGAFRDGRERAAFGRSRRSRGHYGFYLSFDQLVFRESGREEEGLGLFARWGRADDDVNRVAGFWSVGLQYTGPVPGRGADVLGLGAYRAVGSERYRDAGNPGFDGETGVELYYRVAALPWLAVTPDLQYVSDPGGSDTARNALLAALRLRVTF